MSNYQEVLECHLLFKNTEQPEQHVLEAAIWSDLFSAGGSHEALHLLFEVLRNNDTPNDIKDTIDSVFKSASMRQSIMKEWKLYHGYDHAKRHKSQMNSYADYDLASRCIEECHSCFKGLLGYGMVEPSFFCQTGHSFFWLAARSGKRTREQEELMEHLLLLMSPEDLLRPFSVRFPGDDRCSIFQASTLYQTWFKICLNRLGSLLKDGLALLGPDETRQICRYAVPDFADWLLDLGFDLGKPHLNDAAPGWFSVVTRTDPVPMFDWFWRRGYGQPEGFLKYAASFNLAEAVGWIMDHDDSRHDWCDASVIAAESTDKRSTEILKVILPRLAGREKIRQTLAEYIVIKIVYGVYEKAVQFELQGTSLLQIENVAIDKIRTLEGLIGEVDVMGMKIMAGNAGLSRLAIVLEDMNQQV